MNLSDRYTLEIGQIQSIIDGLKKGLIYEKEKRPGIPSVTTQGQKLDEAFKSLIAKIERDAPGDIELVSECITGDES